MPPLSDLEANMSQAPQFGSHCIWGANSFCWILSPWSFSVESLLLFFVLYRYFLGPHLRPSSWIYGRIVRFFPIQPPGWNLSLRLLNSFSGLLQNKSPLFTLSRFHSFTRKRKNSTQSESSPDLKPRIFPQNLLSIWLNDTGSSHIWCWLRAVFWVWLMGLQPCHSPKLCSSGWVT